MLIDSHSHLHDKKFDHDRTEAISRAVTAGVTRILSLGDNLANSRKAIALAESSPHVIAAAGVHPSDVGCWDDETERELEALLDHPRVGVLGEIGLDYYWDKDPAVHARQKVAFRAQLAMARRRGLSVSIHTRNSVDDVLAILAEEESRGVGGVLHCFNGDYRQARAGVDLGYALGVGGTSTYPNSGDLREVLKRIGVEHLVLETDAPYLPPQQHRGKRNEPAYVALVAAYAGAWLGLSAEAVAERTTANAVKALRLQRFGGA